MKLLDEEEELRRLRAEADRRTADLIPAIFHEMFGDTVAPENWQTVSLGEIAFIDAPMVDPTRPEYKPSRTSGRIGMRAEPANYCPLRRLKRTD